ncbi:MAG TPA: hypothetical protein VGA61_02820 [Anaerolineae bacterium]
MRDSLRTSISQFSSAGGRQLARAANVRVVEPAADLPGAERGNLYMLIEVLGREAGQPTLYRNVLNAAQKAFYETEGTLTTALQRAVRSAHVELRKVNESLGADWRAGISCAALQGIDLTIAQVNPALVLVGHPRTVDQFPPEAEPEGPPLGGEERPDVQLIHTQVEPGSLILLAESRWLAYIEPKALAVAVALESPAQTAAYLAQLAGQNDLNALIIGLSQGDAGVYAGPDTSSVGSYAPATFGSAPEEPVEPALPRAAEGENESGPFGRLRRPGNGRRVPAVEGARSVSGRFGAGRGAAAATYEAVGSDFEPAGNTARPPVYAEAQGRRSPWPLVLALVIIPLLIAAIVFSMWWLRNRTQESDFTNALNGASAAIDSAQGLTDESAARQSLGRAKEFLDKARAVKPDDPRLTPVLAKYGDNLNRVNHVTPLYGLVPVWDFSAQGTKLSRILVKGGSAYALDMGQQQISRLVLSTLGDSAKLPDTPVALQRKQQVKDSDQVVGDLVDVTWADAVSNQRSRLLALDSSGNLFSYDVQFGAAREALGGRDQWGGTPQLLAGYNGNLYLVDAKANQIWRYRPSDKGYSGTPDRYFAENVQVNLTGVQSIAIDGSIWLLYADGRLIKFFTGKQDAFTPTGLPTPLSGPTAVAVSADGDQIYIADTGNGRIVELSKKTGQFQRQLRPAQGDVLSDMRDLYLDEAGGAFYIVTSNKLYRAYLPRPGAAPAGTQTGAAAAPTTTPAATPSKAATLPVAPTPKK